jgi:hypothetical protein
MHLQQVLSTYISTDLKSSWNSYKFMLIRNLEVHHHVLNSQSLDRIFFFFVVVLVTINIIIIVFFFLFFKDIGHWPVSDVKKLYSPI